MNIMASLMSLVTFVIVGAVVLWASGLRILQEYERGVVLMLGRFWKVKGPGLVWVVPLIQRMKVVDTRVVTMDVESQDVITKDNVSVKVNAVVYFKVVDPRRATLDVQNFLFATSQIAQTSLRSILGQKEIDSLLSSRDEINMALQKIIDQLIGQSSLGLDTYKSLVIAEVDIKFGFKLLDKIIFKNKGFLLCFGKYKVNVSDAAHQIPRVEPVVCAFLKITLYPIFQVLGPTHLDYLVLGILHEVNAG